MVCVLVRVLYQINHIECIFLWQLYFGNNRSNLRRIICIIWSNNSFLESVVYCIIYMRFLYQLLLLSWYSVLVFFISMDRFVLLLVMYPLKNVVISFLLATFVMYCRDNICSNSLFLLKAQNLSIWCGMGVSIVKELNSNGSKSSRLGILSPSFKDDSR